MTNKKYKIRWQHPITKKFRDYSQTKPLTTFFPTKKRAINVAKFITAPSKLKYKIICVKK